MARGSRQSSEVGLYHVIVRGNNKSRLFHHPKDFEEFIKIISSFLDRYKIKVHHYCIMSNHVHLVASSADADFSGLLRDFKKFTSTEIIKAIIANPQESRKEWLLHIFQEAGKENLRNKSYQFWRQYNQPKECYSYIFTQQKIEYIHDNPVTAGIVDNAEDYIDSSARDYVGRKDLLKVELLL